MGHRTVHFIGPMAVAALAATSLSSASAAPDPAPTGEPVVGSSDERSAQARALFEQGLEAARQQQWERARELFERSSSLVRRSSTLVNLAAALIRLGEGRHAVSVLDQLAAHLRAVPNPHHQDKQRRLRRTAKQMVYRLELRVAPEQALVHVDGELVPGSGPSRVIVLDPGQYRVTTSAPERQSVVFDVSAVAGGREARGVELAELEPLRAAGSRPAAGVPPSAEPPPEGSRTDTSKPRRADQDAAAQDFVPGGSSAQRTAGWIAVGVGGAGLVVGGVAGALAWATKRQAADECPNGVCPPERYDLVDRYDRYRLASTSAFIIGAAFLVSGVTLVATSPAQTTAAPAVRLRVGAGSASVVGSF